MTTTDQKYYTVKQLSEQLAQHGMPLSIKMIRDYIHAGRIVAKKDILRPKIFIIPHTELTRLTNQE
ncbi:hypothetical protein ACFSC6_00045 [Rufibacter sediminis]|uniref:hypothetical protein n=1 Tax=Rufibacter sediminis TaxID=2762756 RepID=UPI00210BAB77|nr:hypothetical protein [Rufibacter sediminis]